MLPPAVVAGCAAIWAFSKLSFVSGSALVAEARAALPASGAAVSEAWPAALIRPAARRGGGDDGGAAAGGAESGGKPGQG